MPWLCLTDLTRISPLTRGARGSAERVHLSKEFRSSSTAIVQKPQQKSRSVGAFVLWTCNVPKLRQIIPQSGTPAQVYVYALDPKL